MCCLNKFTVNLSKSKALVIFLKSIHGVTEQLTINYDSSRIHTIKYLGILIDNKLNFYEHI